MQSFRICALNETTRGTDLIDELCIANPDHWTKVSRTDDPDVFIVQHNYSYMDSCFDRTAIAREGAEYFLDWLDENVVERIARKQAVLVVDGSNEGYARWTSLEDLRREVDARAIPRGQVILLTANYNQPRDSRAENEFEILHHNVYFHKGARLARERPIDPSAVLSRRLERIGEGKDFICLNLTIRPHRIMMAASFIADGIFDRGLISFGDLSSPAGWKNMDASPDNVRRRLRRRFQADDATVAAAEILRSKGRLVVDTDITHSISLEYLTPMDQASETWFSVVTETEMGDGRSCFASEKSLKPIAMLQPFVLVGPPDAMAFMRSVGFKTFGRWIDESYDCEKDEARRIASLRKEVGRLVNLSREDKLRCAEGLRETVEENFRHLERGVMENLYRQWTLPLWHGVRSRLPARG